MVIKPVSFTVVKRKKCTRKVKQGPVKINTFNRFEVLSDQSKDQFEVITEDEISENLNELEISPAKLNSTERQQKCGTRKIRSIALNKVKSHNPKEKIDAIVKTLDKVHLKKVHLNKCRNCNFKKRSCHLDSFSCTIFQKTCFACNKVGHFPKSLNCKKTRKQEKRNY